MRQVLRWHLVAMETVKTPTRTPWLTRVRFSPAVFSNATAAYWYTRPIVFESSASCIGNWLFPFVRDGHIRGSWVWDYNSNPAKPSAMAASHCSVSVQSARVCTTARAGVLTVHVIAWSFYQYTARVKLALQSTTITMGNFDPVWLKWWQHTKMAHVDIAYENECNKRLLFANLRVNCSI